MIMTMIVVFNAVVDDDYDDDEVIKASYVYEAVNFISVLRMIKKRMYDDDVCMYVYLMRMRMYDANKG